MRPGSRGAPLGIVGTILLATAAAAVDFHEVRPTFRGAPADTPASLTAVAVEDWTVRQRSSPDWMAGAGASAAASGADRDVQDVPSGRPASLVGRVDIRRTDRPPVRRPDVSGLSAPLRGDHPYERAAVVYLESVPSDASRAPEPMRGRIDQRDETFVPHVLAVTAGSVVDFPNSDRTYHNVFSLSRTRRFDLGRYAQGRSRAVRFDRPGIVRVFCDIHSHMSAYVLVFDHRFFATTDAEGRYRIDAVPPGRYTATAWYEGERRDTKPVTLPASGGPIDLDFSVP